MYHIKLKNKINYLGEKISILPWQMAERLAVEVDVKNMTDTVHSSSSTDRQAHLFGLDFWKPQAKSSSMKMTPSIMITIRNLRRMEDVLQVQGGS